MQDSKTFGNKHIFAVGKDNLKIYKAHLFHKSLVRTIPLKDVISMDYHKSFSEGNRLKSVVRFLTTLILIPLEGSPDLIHGNYICISYTVGNDLAEANYRVDFEAQELEDFEAAVFLT